VEGNQLNKQAGRRTIRTAGKSAVRQAASGILTAAIVLSLGSYCMSNIGRVSASVSVPDESPSGAQAGSAAGVTHNLMPVPAAIQFRPGRLIIDSSFTAAIGGSSDARLQAALERAVHRLQGRIGIELNHTPAESASVATLAIKCEAPGNPIPSLSDDESYSLEVSSRHAVLSAATDYGALHGLETFLQLLEHDPDGYFIPSASIQDKPRFKWRGLMIDVGRHFQPVEVIKRNLDAMAAVKLNVFHWHLSEDQGFRIESRKYPELAKMGSDGQYFTQDQAREIISYAADRGIRVIPEFDIPGHSTSWVVSHPEFASAPGPYQIERQAGIFEPALDPSKEIVYKFLDNFLGEMAALFPDPYLHIGGDENEGKQWDKNQAIQDFMKKNKIKDNHELQAYFNDRIYKILKKHGKRMIGWDEILGPEVPKDATIQSWRGPDSLAKAAKMGYDGLLSSGYYIDLMLPASSHYAADPIPENSDLTEEQSAHILGGEATMWSEYVSPETIDSRIWPRTAAIAERLWSARAVNDVSDMYRRLDAISIELEELGLTHEKNVGMMLRRLAGTDRVEPLRTLVDLVEPVKQYARGMQHPTTMLSPLTSFVDIARADAKGARRFSIMVDAFLADAPRFQVHRDEVRQTLSEWRDLEPHVSRMIDSSPALHDAGPVAASISQLGEAGLEALSYISAREAAPAGWGDAKLALLSQAAKPTNAGVEIAVIPSLKKLITAATQVQSGRNGEP
jgi:hexosaminidase